MSARRLTRIIKKQTHFNLSVQFRFRSRKAKMGSNEDITEILAITSGLIALVLPKVNHSAELTKCLPPIRGGLAGIAAIWRAGFGRVGYDSFVFSGFTVLGSSKFQDVITIFVNPYQDQLADSEFVQAMKGPDADTAGLSKQFLDDIPSHEMGHYVIGVLIEVRFDHFGAKFVANVFSHLGSIGSLLLDHFPLYNN